jgi:rRNA maturation RNase YbeY
LFTGCCNWKTHYWNRKKKSAGLPGPIWKTIKTTLRIKLLRLKNISILLKFLTDKPYLCGKFIKLKSGSILKESKINFYSENEFILEDTNRYAKWIEQVIASENMKLEVINYIFCDDEYLLKLNVEFLDHDTYTDIITFNNNVGTILQGDIFISTERVKDNAETFGVNFEEELRRVMAHGILHLCGYNDKTEEDSLVMREKEEEKMKLFHVEQL